ncbi:isochorismatase [Maritimibacter sp. 55A14]|uniref:isochorismatase family protein n=1 Tax=Maritimibacter sp. 55A14 TaxID=2174844 RepID=UPI000D6220DE|nr:isochorismatase family protein [Maritimibacter sp. 55A14]PWE33809.1 isochorismatase [Maritimibacter sp. 55A14]
MPRMRAADTALLVVDLQARLMPEIHEGASVLADAERLVRAADLLGLPVLVTEQNPEGLGRTVADLDAVLAGKPVLRKTVFDACAGSDLLEAMPAKSVVVAGCEAHVCVMQTVLGLIAAGREVHVVADAVGARSPVNRDAALARMAAHGADLVTTEMAVFEWLHDARHPAFREALRLVK